MIIKEFTSKLTNSPFWIALDENKSQYYMWTQQNPKPINQTKEYCIQRISVETKNLDFLIAKSNLFKY